METTDQLFDDCVEVWKHEPWQRWSERQWLEAFPEAKEIIPKKVKEWEEVATKALVSCIQRQREIKRKFSDDISRMFCLEWLKWTVGKDLLGACTHLDRLSWLVSEKARGGGFSRFAEALKRAKKTDIVEVAERYLPRLRKLGRNYSALCPFHEERHPSFSLYPDTSSYHCFGCQAHGDVIDFMMKLENINFREAVTRLGGI